MHAFVTATLRDRNMSRGFTLIELIMVVLIVGIMLAVGLPGLTDFVADQRVRTATSDLSGEIAFARAKAIESSRRVYILKTPGPSWNNGWLIYADLDDNGAYTPNATPPEELKQFDGFSQGRMYICTVPAAGDFIDFIAFRPDGRVVRTTAVGVNDGIYIVDPMDGVIANSKIRGLLFGLSGRATTVKLNGTAPPC